MIIILGFDNAGKTTLTNQLSERLGIPVVPSTGPVDQIIQEKFIRENMGRERIFERFPFFEEMVYGNVLRGRSNFSLHNELGKELQASEPIIIYCRPPRETITQWGDREQMKGVIERSDKLLNAWDELMFELIANEWKVLPYDWTKPGAYDLLLEQLNAELAYKLIFKW